MEIEEALSDCLRRDPALNNLCRDRIYPDKVPQGTLYPQVTFFVVSDEGVITQDGPEDLRQSRVQVDAWALSRKQAREIARLVRKAHGGSPQPNPTRTGPATLEGFRGVMCGLFVQGVLFSGGLGEFGAPQHADDVGVYRNTQEFTVWWKEAPS